MKLRKNDEKTAISFEKKTTRKTTEKRRGYDQFFHLKDDLYDGN